MQVKLKPTVKIITFEYDVIDIFVASENLKLTVFLSKQSNKNEKMKTTALYLLVLPVLFTACKPKCLEDSGIRSVKENTVKPYDEIKVSGPLKLVLRQDSTFSVNIMADSNVISHIKAEVSSDKMEVKLDAKEYCGKDSIIVSLGIGSLKKLEASGASRIYTSSAINVTDLEMKLSGATQLNMEVNAGKITANTDGAAKLNLSGQTGVFDLKSKGAIDMDAFAFITGQYNLKLEGVAKLNINVLNDLKVNATGAVDIRYKGSPKNIKEDKSGTYKLEKVN